MRIRRSRPMLRRRRESVLRATAAKRKRAIRQTPAGSRPSAPSADDHAEKQGRLLPVLQGSCMAVLRPSGGTKAKQEELDPKDRIVQTGPRYKARADCPAPPARHGGALRSRGQATDRGRF